MELRELRYFLAVVREENITKAADVLHMTQPTLSRQMAKLEEELGVQLFIRGRRLTLTDAGVMLRRRAEEVVSLMDKIENEFESNEDLGGIISIGSGGLSAMETLLPLMQDFRDKYPKVQYQLYTNSAEFLKERLEQGLLDFVLMLEPIDITKFDYVRMEKKERWGLLVSKDHHLAKKGFVTKEDIVDEALIVSNRIPIQKELEHWLGKTFLELDIFATFNIITNVALFVEKGIASALTLEGSIHMFSGGDLVFLPLYPELSMTSILAWKKFQPNFGAASRFMDYVKTIQKMDIKL